MPGPLGYRNPLSRFEVTMLVWCENNLFANVWFHACTDNSVEYSIENGGAGAISSAFSIPYPVGNHSDNFDETDNLAGTSAYAPLVVYGTPRNPTLWGPQGLYGA
ncbi:hypothetical protein TNCV_3487571 [Trichonephila clavipes]|nr:hypothetical protein TNCV_3487571 [Trichonephila clavipes]